MLIVKKTLKEVNENLVKKLNKEKLISRGLFGIFSIGKIYSDLRYVGEPSNLIYKGIDSCINENVIPIISPIGIDKKGEYYNINADSAFRFLVNYLRPYKIIILTKTGGVLKNEKLIKEIKKSELESLLSSGEVSDGMKLKLEEAKKIVFQGFDVQMTNSNNLIKELFSRKGSGTYIFSRTD